jgi:hypothetical protein
MADKRKIKIENIIGCKIPHYEWITQWENNSDEYNQKRAKELRYHYRELYDKKML